MPFLQALERKSQSMGITDVQLSLASLVRKQTCVCARVLLCVWQCMHYVGALDAGAPLSISHPQLRQHSASSVPRYLFLVRRQGLIRTPMGGMGWSCAPLPVLIPVPAVAVPPPSFTCVAPLAQWSVHQLLAAVPPFRAWSAQEEVFLTIARLAALEAARSDGMQPQRKDLPFGSTCLKVGRCLLPSGDFCRLSVSLCGKGSGVLEGGRTCVPLSVKAFAADSAFPSVPKKAHLPVAVPGRLYQR